MKNSPILLQGDELYQLRYDTTDLINKVNEIQRKIIQFEDQLEKYKCKYNYLFNDFEIFFFHK